MSRHSHTASRVARGEFPRDGDFLVTLDVPLLFGNEQAFSLQMSPSAAANMLFSEGYRIIADFTNTATLTGALILDANREVVNGASRSPLLTLDRLAI